MEKLPEDMTSKGAYLIIFPILKNLKVGGGAVFKPNKQNLLTFIRIE